MSKKLIGIRYDGEPSLRNIASVKWQDGETEGEMTVQQAKDALMNGETIYVPGPLGLAILSINVFPDGYEGISSVPISQIPGEALAKLGLQ